MKTLKTPEQIELMRSSAQLVSRTLGLMAEMIEPGVNLLELDRKAEEFIRDHQGTPSFKGYNGYPNSLCISVNEVVVHGIPTDYVIKEEDIVSVDCGIILNEWHGDHAYTFAMPKVNDEVMQLLQVTLESLYLGIEQMAPGKRMGDLSNAIQQHAESHGYGVVRELIGHGLGRALHEKPEVPNYGKKGQGVRFEEGMVIAIEPMINMGTRNIKQLKDGWTIVTADRKPSAHYEHDVAFHQGKPDILSTFDFVEAALEKKGLPVITYQKA